MSWEAVIGLEVHVQLKTAEKLFCPDSTVFGADPNSNVCPVCLGLPGALPVLNQQAVELAVRTALALECRVHRTSVFARKNYFYPDLPKGYQISQFERPLATGGLFSAPHPEGGRVEVRIRRIHMEEDAGKSVHDRLPHATAVDLNRTGTPLVEIVTEPDLRSPEGARAFLQGLKHHLEYLEVSDCNMEEGSLRVDANVSLRRSGTEALGTKTELKNLNTFSGVEKALVLEIERQRAELDDGRAVEHQTLLWDGARGEIRPMRTKEESHDYRYFPDPDLPPLIVEESEVEAIRGQLPEFPQARRLRFQEEFGLPEYDAGVLTATRGLADYFERAAAAVGDGKLASNWVMGPVLQELNQRGLDPKEFPLDPVVLAELVELVQSEVISHRVGRKVLVSVLETGKSPAAIVEEEGLAQVKDEDALEEWVSQVLDSHPDEVQRLQEGEDRLLGFFVGQVMRVSEGKADPKEVSRRLRDAVS